MLYTTRFGVLLSIKIILFLIMVSTAIIVITYIGPKMRRKWGLKGKVEIPQGKRDLAYEELHTFDGKEGRPAYVVYKGLIYDVTASKLWKNGSHLSKHLAGHDLTDALKTAPHGEEKLCQCLRQVNSYHRLKSLQRHFMKNYSISLPT